MIIVYITICDVHKMDTLTDLYKPDLHKFRQSHRHWYNILLGKDDTSVELAQAINAAEVSSRLEEEHFVAIRLESGSEAYRFFAQICILLYNIIIIFLLLILFIF